ncbi:MAG TPA: sigma-54 dependent transcriptional regulator [Opitutaceae bacterium]|nr:sigma-54 dependent transcriptional regulator [Opitutaceae bacterium]
MSLEKILVIDDEPIVRLTLEELLRLHRFTVSSASSLVEADKMVARESFDLLFVDVHLPDGNGQEFLERISALPERPMVVMITGYGTIESAVSCMRAGAFDYLIKPFTAGQIEVVLQKAESFSQLVKVNRALSESNSIGEGELLGRSLPMTRLRQLIEKVAPTDATVLITGESGTGKEMLARELYRLSPRRKEPFIKVNCAAVSETLIESEFFGHEKGSFTGATERREGRFELADRGTLLLDEVSEIPLHLQAKLLRVLQEREFERVGGTKSIKVNVRVLATSNRDLLQVIEKGSFRQDLYYRLNVFPLHMPPLRERREDILLLAENFLGRCARKHGLKLPGLTDAARTLLLNYSWPGNVRELQNTIERAVILTENGRPVSATALSLPVLDRASTAAAPLPPSEPSPAVAAPPEPPLPASAKNGSPAERMEKGPALSLQEIEKNHILSALRSHGGNRTQTAAALGISIRTLRNKLAAYRAAGEAIEAEAAE